MRNRSRNNESITAGKAVMLSTAALSIGLAFPVNAQEPISEAPSNPVEATATEATTSNPIAPAESKDALNDISEVIVTARRIQERLQDVPISMTVFTQDQLSERNVLSGKDLATYTPSLSANARFGTENTSFAIRGFSQELRTTASVGMYFADVIAPRGGGVITGGDGAGPGSFFDLQNVQVLKGPQGTLFGRNTTGGAVLLVPHKPTPHLEGYIEESIGNYGLRRTESVVNVPLGENVRFRAGLDTNTREGYLDNISGIGPDHFGDVHYTAARASLVVDVAPSIENYSIATYSLSETNGGMPQMLSYDAAAAPSNVVANLAGQMARDQIARGAGRGDYAVENDDPDVGTQQERWQGINTTTWNASDTLTVKNIASYAELTNETHNNAFGSNFFLPAVILGGVPTGQYAGTPIALFPTYTPRGIATIDQWTFTEELQVQGRSSDDRWVWQAGGYYESSQDSDRNGASSPALNHCADYLSVRCDDPIGDALSRVRDLPPGSIQVGTLGWQVGGIQYKNLGVYTQSTYDLTEQLKLTAGIRYTKDEATGNAEVANWKFFGADDTPRLFCNSAPSVAVATTAQCRGDYEKDSSAPTWVVGLDYKPSEDWLLYSKYSRGYRMGSVNPYAATGYETFEQEKVDAYEIGSKTTFRGALRGTFNIAAFYNDFADQQLQYGFSSTTGAAAGNAAIVNAGSSRIYGAEVESVLLPFTGFSLSLSYAYLNTKIEELGDLKPNPPYDLASPSTVAGSPLPYTPENKFTATASYSLPIDPSHGKVSMSATYSYQSDMFVTTNGPFGTVPSYDLVNLNLSWNAVQNSPLDLALFVTNVTDEVYRTSVTGSWSQGFEAQLLGEPRMYGARVRVNFGS